jgi:N-acetylneuraminic acid mutarotase
VYFDLGVILSPRQKETVMPWAEKTALPLPRNALAAATSDAPAPNSGSWIYAIGGASGEEGTVVAYNTQEPGWSPVATLIDNVWGEAAATSGPGGLHVVGGISLIDDFATVLATHQIYNTAANEWVLSIPLQMARCQHAAVTDRNGMIYAIGGNNGSQTAINSFLNSVEMFDPSTELWTYVAELNTARSLLAAVTGPDGKIYAIGGSNASPGVLQTVEVFDPSNPLRGWTPGPSLPVALWGPAAAVGPDGLIYVMGGTDGQQIVIGGSTIDEALNSVYSYDPSTPGSTWVLASASMPTARWSLAAATGPDGLIYAIGGNGNTQEQALSNVEAYAVATTSTAPDPYIGNGTYQSPDIILVNQSTHNVVPIGGAPGGAWDTLLIPYSKYTISCVVYNDANVAVPNTKVRFWHFPGGVGTAGALISEVTVTVPPNGSIVVTSPTSSPFQSGATGAHECAAVSIANAQSQYFSNDPTIATAVIDPTVPHPAGSGHFGSAWRNTNSVTMGGEIKVWNFPFVANLDGIEPARVKITATATKVAADWDRTDEMVKLRKVVEGACSNCRLPLFLIPEIRAHLPPADCDVRIRVGGNDVGSSRSRGNAEHHAAVKPGENAPFQVSGRIPDDAQAGDIFLVNVAANYPAARGRNERIVEYLEVIYVR